ncbi:uncharacterized protein LOC114257308 [Camellia sinensis]|uniref:uncharacterized protein LOC114257308 n=1 Tax=Camellia sinensis TaxID=4442 RepID=UPI001035F6B5|nr:uncharacterized protein LOC114257308 [Camellia sinensis]
MYLACEKNGQYRATRKLKYDGNNTSRITGTKKYGCPFDMRAHRFSTNDEWILTVVCELHNHPPAEHLEGHSYAGRLSKDEKTLLMDMSKSIVNTKEILVTLKQRDALNISTLKTIYNVRHRNKVVERTGRSHMQHLLGKLAKAKSAHAKLKRQLGSCQVSFEVSFEKIHSLFELQHTNIKASFEKILTVVQHQFKPSQFRELRGNVSIFVLEYLLVESKRANSIGIDTEACGCVLHHTHGLPCAHEIANYIRQYRPIQLATIHSQWRQLHISIYNKEEETEVTCHAEVELFVKKFNESDETIRLELLKKLKEIVYPGSTFLIEQEVKPKTRPRGHKKINVSTCCDPYAFELVQSGHDSFSPRDTQITTLASTLGTKKKRHAKEKEKVNAKGKVYITRTIKPGAYVDAFPFGLKPYIKFAKDVVADGNCGFRAIAALIGPTENDCAQVRHDLLGELHTHKEEYITLYGSYKRFEELTSILSDFEDSLGYTHWMTIPDMGHLVASCYNLVLYHLSLQQCLTFLPLRTVPVPQLDRREIAIGFVNENHFVQALSASDREIDLTYVLVGIFGILW